MNNAELPFARSPRDVSCDLETDLVRGLSTTEASERLALFGPNTIDASDQDSWLIRLGKQFRDPLVLLLLVAIIISLVAWYFEDRTAWPIDAFVIAAIVAANAALGAFQEHRADKASQKLAQMTGHLADVIRSAEPRSVPVTEIVRGDLLVITEGAVVPADARVTSAESLHIAEAALTGESAPRLKGPDPVAMSTTIGDRTCMVHAGTAVVSGHGQAIVTATGMDTEVGHIAGMLATTSQTPTPLEREIRSISRSLGVAVLAISIVLSIAIAATSPITSGSDVVDILIIGVSVAVAAVPEGLPAVLSLVLALGVSRMARRHALVKRLASAEALGAATVICTDKTGTLTRNEMKVHEVIVPAGRFIMPGALSSGPVHDQALLTLLAGTVTSNAHIDTTATTWKISGDPTETSLAAAAHELGLTEQRLASVQRIAELPFQTERRRMSVLVDGLLIDGRHQRCIVTKGAPDVILDLCSARLQPDGPVNMTDEDRRVLAGHTMTLADQAMRTIAVAYRQVEPGAVLTEAEERGLTWLGVVGMFDPPRDGAAEAIATAQRAGIRVIMVTGDHPHTAASIAVKLGIASKGDSVVSGNDVDGFSDMELGQALSEYSVFARVTPAHKLRMVRVLQDAGEVVAMTGDGVNDAPALKAADIGTAMGMGGTDVAREAADMVLIDDNFATIIEAIRGGRSIFVNVKSFLRYLLSSNAGEVLTIVFGVIFAGVIGLRGEGIDVLAPLTAAQILWVNLVTDSGPALALGVDPVDPDVMNEMPRRVGDRAIDPPMLRGVISVGVTMALVTLLTLDAKLPGGVIDGTSDLKTARTAAFTVLVLAQLFNCFNARSDTASARHEWTRNPWLFAAIAASLTLQLCVVHLPFLQKAFGTAALSFGDWLMATAVASSVLVVGEARKWFDRAVIRQSRHSR